MSTRNLNMSKTEWDGAEKPKINNFYTGDNIIF